MSSSASHRSRYAVTSWRAPTHESAVASRRDGVYWAVVTMTTVGYGDKTPKTTGGRAIHRERGVAAGRGERLRSVREPF